MCTEIKCPNSRACVKRFTLLKNSVCFCVELFEYLTFVPVEYFTFVMSTLVILCKSKRNIKNWSLGHSSMGALVILLVKKKITL